jgi:uncharacterized protein YcgL (UPF0745 family)
VKQIICDVYRSSTKENLYIYVVAEDGLSKVPKDLLSQFGEPVKAMSFTLTEDRSLAKEDPEKVLQNLNEQGFHVQLPPADDRFHG